MKLYNSTYFNPDAGPAQLQKKVMFDIRYYFCRRGNENVEFMTKDMFKLRFDMETKISYVMKIVDELTKNHKENDDELITGFMPSIKNCDGSIHPLCPVRSFENYFTHLNLQTNWLWQKPLKCFPNDITKPWYEKRKVGRNIHDSFMGTMSTLCNLSKHYTNHCVRVTGVTNLRKSNFTLKQVMAVSSHKSIQSLAIYEKWMKMRNL